ncbi:hypothetical protein TNCV_4649671 [Trichonephila clavipes]|uniref:Uncharacterized protein n=1 Tax=Trichonephila clavipes TaxID=2585209 RepID=A0A8X6T291_TRICX|nr:hypothetical protein TNCV_4649671 [Trichonephila clavipes]
MPNVNKMSDHPELLKQLALEGIDGIPLDAVKIYTEAVKESQTLLAVEFQLNYLAASSKFREEMLTTLLSSELS